MLFTKFYIVLSYVLILGVIVLKEVCKVNGCWVYVEKKSVIQNFFVDDLFFVLFENGHWYVECDDKGLGSDGEELQLLSLE